MILHRRTDLVTRELDGETVILDRVGAKVHQLNLTAAYVWQRCDGASSIQEIAAGLAEEFGVDIEMAMRDVARIVELFGNAGLLVARHPGGQASA